jgi:hypothetical protein
MMFLLQGEGVAFRGRAIVELQTLIGEKPLIPVEDLSNDDIMRVQVKDVLVVRAVLSVKRKILSAEFGRHDTAVKRNARRNRIRMCIAS